MRARSLLVPVVVGLVAAGCAAAAGRVGPGTPARRPSSTTTVTTALPAPPPAAEFVAGDGDTDCPPATVVARARPAAPAFPRGGTVTIHVTLTASVDCTWHPMEFWRPFVVVAALDGTPIGREPASAPGAVARVVVHLRAGEEVLVHTSEWDEHTFGPVPSPGEERAAQGPLVAAGRYLAVATVDGITPAPAEPFEVVA